MSDKNDNFAFIERDRPALVSDPAAKEPAVRRFRKKPLVIQAAQFRADGVGYVELCHFIGIQPETALPEMIQIFTLEGPMRADRGDWIIRGVKNELYPCKPGIFAATYEEVTE